MSVGAVALFPAGGDRARDYARFVWAVACRRERLAHVMPPLASADTAWDGVYGTLFKDRALYYNPGGEAKTKSVRWMDKDLTIDLPPHAIAEAPPGKQ